jgi:hypothetical protein
MQTQTFTSFKDLARAVHADDVAKAKRLAKSAALRKAKPRAKTGPAVAR